MQKRINYSLLLAALIVVFSSSTASAIKLDENRIGAISQNCSIIKERLRRIESAGAKSRVYLGTQYESVYSGLMTNFSLRLMRNGIANQDIAAQQAAFQSERERFRNDFVGYSQELQSLIAMDCKKEPEKFYNQLEITRAKREDITKSIHRMDELIIKHRKSILDMRSELIKGKDDEQ